ncbi:MAG: VCBS repeat-containing protein [Candidatus Manganitrophus sp. SB1]|nr:VCBS repeat-containing protein [Candidatus Manganitrophus morganii]
MNSNKSSSIIVVLFFISALGIGACGSGDGGGTSTPTEVNYTGKTDPAHITGEKANLLIANVLTGPGTLAVSKPSNASAAPRSGQPQLLSRSFIAQTASARRAFLQSTQALMKTSLASAAPNPVNETEDCTSSGTVTITGAINDDGTGTLKFHYVDCDDGDGFMTNGDATFQVDAVDPGTGIILDGTIQSTALRTEDSLSEVIFNGSIRSQVLLSDQREILIVNGIFKDSRSAKLFKLESVVIVFVYDDYLNPTRHTESISGRIYDSVEGYVNIATGSPLIFSNEGLNFPDDGGLLVIIGAEGSRARLLAISASKARIEVDTDGDGIFETAAFYSWTNLTGAPSPNEPPTGIVTLSPAMPKRGDTLTATVTASDPENDPLTYAYAWTRNGTPIDGANTPTLDGNQFVKGDIVTVIVGLSDGLGSTSIIASITIGDSPLVAEPTNPVNAAYGVPLELQLGVSDPDGDSVSYRLAYGPGGMRIDQTGKISWTPTGPMFDETLEVHFGVRATSGEITVETAGTITVTDPGHPKPLVRTGIQIPAAPDGIVIADFNGDLKNEVLITNQNLLYTLIFDGTNYVQNWVYPFDLTSIMAITAHDLTGDGHPDMIVGVSSGIIILDGVNRKIVKEITDGYSFRSSIRVIDIDNDGGEEIIYLGFGDDSFSFLQTINVYDADTLRQEWQSPPLDLGPSLAIGNVDNDPTLEIVTSNGYVYDGATHENQWAYGAGFGALVDTGDLNNDGVEEIVSNGLQFIRVYSAVLKSPLWEIQREVSALVVTNIDHDPQAEIIVADRPLGDVIAYDGSRGAGSQEWSISEQNYGVWSITVGDTDNDGSPEFVWGAGVEDSLPDSLVIAGLNPSIQVEWTNGTRFDRWFDGTALLQLDGPFVGGHWLSTSTGQRQAIFASPRSNSGHGGTRLIGIDPVTGNFTTSSEIGTNFSGIASLSGADYDGDGVDEVFLTTSSAYDGYFTVYDFIRDLPEWTSAANLGIGRAVTRGDLNRDGHDDLIALTVDGYIYAYDVFNSTLIWKSTQLPSYGAFDLEVADLDGDGALEIIATATESLLVYKKQGNVYLLNMLIGVNAGNHLAVGDLDSDGTPEIIITSSAYDTAVFIYDGVTFDLKGQYTLSVPISELAVPLDGSGNLLIGTSKNSFNSSFETSAKLITVDGMTGTIIWSSPPLLGDIVPNSLSFADINNDGAQELIFGTTRAMYITQ